ncbi:PTS sugar transporter subunit IIB [Escherichia coli]
MNITLARIDDRLIHGQVTTVWSKVANAQRIIICNDEVYNDEVRRTLLRQAAPPGMKVNVVNIEKPSRFITTRNIRTKPFFIFSLAHRMP